MGRAGYKSPQRAAWGRASPAGGARYGTAAWVEVDVAAVPDPSRRAERVHRPAAANAGAGRATVLFASFAGGPRRLGADPARRGRGPRRARPSCCAPEGRAGRARCGAAGIPVLGAPRAPARAAGRRRAHAAAAGACAWPPTPPRSAPSSPPCARARWSPGGCAARMACAAALPPCARARRWSSSTSTCCRAAGVATAVRAAAARADRVIALSRRWPRDLDPRGRLRRPPARGRTRHRLDRFAAAARRPADPPTALLLGAIVRLEAPRPRAGGGGARRRASCPDLRLVVAGHAVGEGERARCWRACGARAAEPDLAGRVEFPGALADPRAALARRVLPAALLRRRAVRARPARGDGHRPARGRPGRGRARSRSSTRAAAACTLRATRARRPTRWSRCSAIPASCGRAGGRARARVAERFGAAPTRAGGGARPRRRCSAPRAADPQRRGGPHARHGHATTRPPSSSGCSRSVERRLPAAAVVVADSGSRDESVAVARGAAGRATRRSSSTTWATAAPPTPAWRAWTTPACVVLNPDVELRGRLARRRSPPRPLRPGAPERLLAPLVLRPDGTPPGLGARRARLAAGGR